MKNYVILNVVNEGRVELHDQLGLTGAEISINTLPAGVGVPFVHYHKTNEEIYYVFDGKGYVVIDKEKLEVAAGSWLRIAPEARRQFFASNDTSISYVCIQVKGNSLEGYTMTDAVVE